MFNLIKEILKKNPKSRKIYKSDSSQTIRVVKEIREYNDEFSETFFMSWMSTTFIRYVYLSSNHDEKLKHFEEIYLSEKAKKNWAEDLELYDLFKIVTVNNIDFLDFFHTEKEETMNIRLHVVGKGIKGSENKEIEEMRILYYDIELVKQDSKKISLTNITANCPNCGAPTKIATYGICDHCGQMVSIYDNVWKIKNIEMDM